MHWPVTQCATVGIRAFNPDLILLSAGFDGGGVDHGNVKLVDETRPNGLDLEESDFVWLTKSILGMTTSVLVTVMPVYT